MQDEPNPSFHTACLGNNVRGSGAFASVAVPCELAGGFDCKSSHSDRTGPSHPCMMEHGHIAGICQIKDEIC